MGVFRARSWFQPGAYFSMHYPNVEKRGVARGPGSLPARGDRQRRLTGLEMPRQLRSAGKNQHVPVIVITVVAAPGAVAGFAVHDVLPKPLDVDTLLDSLLRADVAPSASRTILVVDDDPAALDLMASATATPTVTGSSDRASSSGSRLATEGSRRSPPRRTGCGDSSAARTSRHRS